MFVCLFVCTVLYSDDPFLLLFFFLSFTPGWSPAYLFEVAFVKCVCIWRGFLPVLWGS